METRESTKIVQEYQASDSQGNPIGKLTHFEADTWEEMATKLKDAHIAASQALDRQNKAFSDLKGRKLTPKITTTASVISAQDAARYAATVSNQSAPASEKTEAIRKLGGIAEVEEQLQQLEAERAKTRGMQIALEFQRNHVGEYFACAANSQAINDFLVENNLEFTLDNLEIAFVSVAETLARDPKKANAINAEAAVENNPTMAVQENQAHSSEQKKTTGFGMPPGTGSQATRPTNNQNAGKMDKKAVLAKRKADPVWWKRVLKDPVLLAEVNAALQRG